MVRSPWLRLALLAGILAFVPSGARAEDDAEGAESAAGLARLTSPAAGSRLVAGSLVPVEWAPEAGLAALPHAEEWEAFLSLDGGRTYPLRITPHLEISLRRFLWQVPRLPTRDARLMLRFGDERREIGFEAPQRFTIADEGLIDLALLEAEPALTRGERPRNRDRGVVAWTEGRRDGESLRERVAAGAESGIDTVQPAAALRLFLLPEPKPRAALAAPAMAVARPLPDPAPAPGPRVHPLPSAPVRLRIHRFNE